MGGEKTQPAQLELTYMHQPLSFMPVLQILEDLVSPPIDN